MSLDLVAPWLRCPVCEGGVRLDDRTLRCADGHTFDLAKQSYVNLTGRGVPRNADTGEMVAARERFLGRGHYRPIAAAVSRRLGGARRVLEVGAGTGYYLAAALDALPESRGLATDVSVAACRRAAKAHPRMAAVVADTWAGLPVRSSAVDALLCVFAPRNAAEFCRVLSPGGVLVIVTPAPDHLASLRATHGLLNVPADKADDLRKALVDLDAIATHHVSYSLDLGADDIADLIAMGPNAFHAGERIPGPARIDVSVHVSVFRKPGCA